MPHFDSAPSPFSPSVPLVRLTDVQVTLQGVRALNNVNLTIHAGEHRALLGPNGAGKSTLLRVLRGETRPDQRPDLRGGVRWFTADSGPEGDDAPLTGRNMTALLSPGLQEHYLRQGWNIRGEELVIAGLYDDYLLYRDPTEDQRHQCAALAAHFRAGALPSKPINTLSQGQLRILLLMRALIRQPRLLLLDEAADGLDAPTRCMFLILLDSLAALPTPPTMVLTTHRAQLPAFLKKTARMDHGTLTEAPILSELAPATPFFANTAPPAFTKTFARSAPRFGHPAALAPLTSRDGAHIVLSHATVFVDRAEILHDIDWEIRPGEQWTVLGGNGAGKSTLLRVIMGEEAVAVGGSITRHLPRHGGENPDLAHIRQGIRLVSDRLQALYTWDDTAANVVFSGFDGGIGARREASEAERAEVARCLALVGLSNQAERPFRRLSTGQARRVLLARALVGEPELLLLDEPFSGLDTESRAAMMATLEARMAEGLQTVLVSHHEEDILPLATHFARLEQGRITVE